MYAAWFPLLALALRRNQARVRYWLWLAASYKFLLPFSWLVSIGHRIQWHAAQAIVPPTLSAMVDAVNAPVFLTAISSTKSAPDHLSVLLYIIWAVLACGFATVIARWFVEWLRIRRIVSVASPLKLGLPIRVVSTAARLEPGVFGVFRPVLVLPEGIAARLTRAQLKTVIDHELCHVRRRDNLTAAVHMLVEALFWFHPLVWWLGARLLDERECACDQEVLQAGSQAQVYAESILKVCEFYLECPLKCVSGISGSDLKKRMERIMKKHFGEALSARKKFLLAFAAVIALAVPVVAGVLTSARLLSQPSASQLLSSASGEPAFDVVSITAKKVDKPGDLLGNTHYLPLGTYTLNHMGLRPLIAEEFFRDYNKRRLVIGGPDWIDSETFDIKASAKGSPGMEEEHLMIQRLVEEKFKLAMHHEVRQLPIYALVMVEPLRLGPQLTLHSDSAKCSNSRLEQPGPSEPMPAYCKGFFMNPRPGNMRETGNEVVMKTFGTFLSQSLDRTVIDRTGLNGTYDFAIEFAPSWGWGSEPAADGSAPPPSGLPSIFTAVREQLGLELLPQTGPVDVIVIDHVEEPMTN